jgi:hypothetical protein
VLVIDATRFKTPSISGDDVRLHQSYDLRAGRMEQLQVTDAGYPVGSSVEQTQQSQSFVLQRTAASQLHLEDEQG